MDKDEDEDKEGEKDEYEVQYIADTDTGTILAVCPCQDPKVMRNEKLHDSSSRHRKALPQRSNNGKMPTELP